MHKKRLCPKEGVCLVQGTLKDSSSSERGHGDLIPTSIDRPLYVLAWYSKIKEIFLKRHFALDQTGNKKQFFHGEESSLWRPIKGRKSGNCQKLGVGAMPQQQQGMGRLLVKSGDALKQLCGLKGPQLGQGVQTACGRTPRRGRKSRRAR